MDQSNGKVVAVRLTGTGVGAIAVIAVVGSGAGELVGRMVRRPTAAPLRVGEAMHEKLLHPLSGETLDDAMVVKTAEDRFELHVHGGTAVVETVMQALAAAGARLGTIEEVMSQTEISMSRARTMTAVRLVAAGTIYDWARRWQTWLEKGGELWRVQSSAQWILTRSRYLALLLEGARVAIVGPPNAGKSTLANALLGRQVAITSDIAGTTRDWVDAQGVFVSGAPGNIELPVILVDTAGVRETGDSLEQESIARTHQQARGADVVILVFDGSRDLTQEEQSLMETYRGALLVANKADLPSAWNIEDTVRVSAKNSTSLDELMRRTLEKLDLAEVHATEPFAFTDRQRELLAKINSAPSVGETTRLLGEVLN